ncbi:MAG: phage tail tape measure protein [Pseudomonadales bacterium]|nr:phage tail tape measure protein [Pseudomonadales bacterium]
MANTKGIRAGRAFVELGVDDKIAKGLQKAEQRLKAFGEGVRSVGLKLGALGSAALTFLGGTVKAFVDTGDALDEMSARTGVSVETLSELGWAADLAGADLETLETGLRKMQKVVTEAATGSASATEALARLGLSVTDLVNLNPEQQFKLIADRLSKVQDPTLRAALAMEVFGKSGTRLLPLLADGAKGLEEYQRRARELGLTVSSETAKDAAALADTLDTLWRVLKQSAFTIGAALAPTIKDLGDAVTRAVVRVTEWLKQNKALIVTALQVAAVVTAVGVGLIVAGTLISGIGAVFGWLATVVTGIGAAFAAIGTALAAIVSPIGLVITAAVALGTTLLVVTGAGSEALTWLGEQFGRLRGTVYKVMGGIADALAAGDINLAAQILWLSLKLAWQQGVAALNRAWLEAKRFFLSIAYGMWYGALAAAEIGFHALEVAWIETTSFLSQTWTSFTAGFQKAWNTAINWTTKRLLELWGLFDETLDVEAAKKMADEDLSSVNAEIDRQRDAALQAREAQRQAERERAKSTHEGALEEIGRQDQDAQRQLDQETDARVKATQQQLDEARKALDDAVAEARRKREAADAEGAAPKRPPIDPLAGLDDQLAGLGSLLAQKISVIGTFNPLGAAGLGGGSAAERTARATEETAKHTKRLAESAGRLTFA